MSFKGAGPCDGLGLHGLFGFCGQALQERAPVWIFHFRKPGVTAITKWRCWMVGAKGFGRRAQPLKAPGSRRMRSSRRSSSWRVEEIHHKIMRRNIISLRIVLCPCYLPAPRTCR